LNTYYWVDKAPSTAASLEIASGKLFVGTTDGKIYESDREPFGGSFSTSADAVPALLHLLE